MSEPQFKSTPENEATSPSVEEISRNNETTAPTAPPAPVTTPITTTELTGPVKTLKDAFPDLDVEVIETILDSQGGNLDAAFEILLGMSDPTYKPSPSEIAQQSTLLQDEEYARRLAREGDAHYPQQQNNNPSGGDNQPLFNFQEELPIIKEKVIEAGTAAKNKILNLYNQFMASTGESSSNQSNQSLESGMGNLNLNNNRQQRPLPTPKDHSVDLYEWDGQGAQQPATPVRNPLLTRKESATSTPTAQLLSDEEFARQLATEQDDTARGAHTAPAKKTNQEEQDVTFSTLHDKDTIKPTGAYTLNDDEDDLDDLFDKHDSIADLKAEEEKLKSTSDASKK